MKPENYREMMKTLESKEFHGEHLSPRLLHGLLGMVSEVGEFADAIKKFVFYGREFKRWDLLEELGDERWYQELICDELGVTMEDVEEMNYKKLLKRYPNKMFKDVVERDYKAEQEAAEQREPLMWTCPQCKTLNGTGNEQCAMCDRPKAKGRQLKGTIIDDPAPDCLGNPNQVPGCSKCEYKQDCFEKWDAQFKEVPTVPTPAMKERQKIIDQEHTTPECFGQASDEDHSNQKCLGCLDRGPCGRETEKKPVCFGSGGEEDEVCDACEFNKTCSGYDENDSEDFD